MRGEGGGGSVSCCSLLQFFAAELDLVPSADRICKTRSCTRTTPFSNIRWDSRHVKDHNPPFGRRGGGFSQSQSPTRELAWQPSNVWSPPGHRALPFQPVGLPPQVMQRPLKWCPLEQPGSTPAMPRTTISNSGTAEAASPKMTQMPYSGTGPSVYRFLIRGLMTAVNHTVHPPPRFRTGGCLPPEDNVPPIQEPA